MKFINFTIVKFSICLTAGILFAYHSGVSSKVLSVLLGVNLILLIIAWYLQKSNIFPSPSFGIICFLCFFLLGAVNYSLRLPDNDPLHFFHDIDATTNSMIRLKIREELKPSAYYDKFLAEVHHIDDQKSSGQVLLEMKQDSIYPELNVDEYLLVYSDISRISQPLNPGQFDYAQFMQSRNIYGRIRFARDDIVERSTATFTLKGISANTRRDIVSKLHNTSLDSDAMSMLQALLLGNKAALDKETYDNFISAGAVHILAVSGLHVGIIFMVISFLLKPIRILGHGRIVHSIMVVILLWGFAFITGLSASVTRAVCMFSLFAFAGILNRRTNAFNTLFLSFFILIIINPLWIFHVGFQLSYAAVFSILWMHPVINGIIDPRYWVLKRIWDIFTVTLAAQFGIFPLSIFYFHQFPGLFFLTNIVILPFLGIVLCLGLLVVFLAAINRLPEFLAEFYSMNIDWLNRFVAWVAHQDSFLFKDISFSQWQLLLSYILLLCLGRLAYRFNFRRLRNALVSVLLIISTMFLQRPKPGDSEFIVFHKYSSSLMGIRSGTDLLVFSNDSAKSLYAVRSYRVERGINDFEEARIPGLMKYKNKNILVLDSLGIYPEGISADLLILTHNPEIHLERTIDSLSPAIVIADGSNYPSMVKRWEESCEKRKLPFHHTGSKGAFIYR